MNSENYKKSKDKIDYLKISFIAMNAIENLEKNEKTPKKFEQAYDIMDKYEKSWSKEYGYNSGIEIYHRLNLEDLNEIIENPNKKEVILNKIINIRKTRLMLERILENREVLQEDIKKGIEIFKELNERCLSHCSK